MNVTLPSSFPGSFRRVLLVLVCLLAAQVRCLGQSQDDVTVAFVYNFARFVEWPASTFSDAKAPFTVGFVGRPALAQKFTQAVQGKNVAGRELAVRSVEDPAAATNCQIVFIGADARPDAIIRAIQGRPVLSLGETDGFIAAGGMIAFSREGARLVFDVNPAAIKAATLNPGEKLTKAARSLKGG